MYFVSPTIFTGPWHGGRTASKLNGISHFPLEFRRIQLIARGRTMRCFYSQDLEFDLTTGHPFPMDKFRHPVLAR
jgi:hypothetical protein